MICPDGCSIRNARADVSGSRACGEMMRMSLMTPGANVADKPTANPRSAQSKSSKRLRTQPSGAGPVKTRTRTGARLQKRETEHRSSKPPFQQVGRGRHHMGRLRVTKQPRELAVLSVTLAAQKRHGAVGDAYRDVSNFHL